MSLSIQPVTEKQTSTTHAVVSPVQVKPIPAKHFQSIDGLRGFACLAVVFSHFYMSAGQGTWPFGLPLIFARGRLGVEVFFVLSGFCLAYPIMSHPERPDDWKLYARRRARRILPAYWAAVLLFALSSAAIRHFHVGALAASDLFHAPGARQCLYTALLIGVGFNPSFWTLVVEARWYFIFPVLILLHRRVHNIGLFLVACAVATIYIGIQRHRPSASVAFLTAEVFNFLPLFALGMISAHLLTKPNHLLSCWTTPLVCRVGLAISIVLVGLFIPVYRTEEFNSVRLVPAGLLAVFLLLAALRDPVFQRLFAWKPLSEVGLFSYSLYLLHQPIISLMYCITKPLQWTPMAQFFFYYGFMTALCLGVAYLFYCVAERPFLSQKQKG